jgi:hypothetical protein
MKRRKKERRNKEARGSKKKIVKKRWNNKIHTREFFSVLLKKKTVIRITINGGKIKRQRIRLRRRRPVAMSIK